MSEFESLSRGELVRMLYRLGLKHATGVLTIAFARRREVLVLRRGFLMTAEADATDRQASQRLARLANSANGGGAMASFDGGVAAYPPGAVARQFSLAAWARDHLERQVDAGRARDLTRDLAGVRLSIRCDLAPAAATCDAVDSRILAAMRQPRRLDQIGPLARTPRFRLLAFMHFLREVGALQQDGIAAPPPPRREPDTGAHRVLGVAADADRQSVKRAYRRLARALHPDLQPDLSAPRRRTLERKLAAVTHAYEELSSSSLC